MKKAVQVALFAAVIVCAAYFAVSLYNSGLLEKSKPTSFTAGEYTDYYYSKLDTAEKQAYTAVKKSISDFPKSIETPEITGKQLSNVLNALVYDDPSVFMLRTCTLKTVGTKYYFVPDYTMTKDEFNAAKTKLDAELARIEKLIPNGTDYEKELFCHDYIINNCEYADTDDKNESTVIGVFFDKEAKCSGYAKAFKMLLSRAGIESILVTGIAKNFTDEPQNHMWNAVKLGEKWYFTDTTWDDPLSDSGESLCRHVFFNASADMLKETHTDYSISVSCTSDDMFYYAVNKAYYSEFNDSTVKAISDLIAKAADNGEESAEFMFTKSALTEQAIDKLFSGQKIYRALETANLKSSKKIVTNSVKYSVDYDSNLVIVFFNIKD